MEDENDRGVCILSFDGGGSGSHSQFLIMRQYMNRLAVELGTHEEPLYPADYFGVMGGVGFGGLAAFMLGQLRMTIEEAEEAFRAIITAVFPSNSDLKPTPETNTHNLRVSIEKMLEARKIPPDSKMYDNSRPPTKCKVSLYAATSANVGRSHTFRAYSCHGTRLNPTIVEALCATIASPPLFSPVKIGPHMREQEFVGAAVGANNPTRDLLKEAAALLGNDKRVAQIISLGAGRTRAPSVDVTETTEMASHLLRSLTKDCEAVTRDLSNRLINTDVYVRFNVPNDTENTNLDWNGFPMIESQTKAYLETTEVTRNLELSLQYLHNRVGTATLGQINFSATVKLEVKTSPALSPHYIVRQREWSMVVHHLVDTPSPTQKVFSITGMPGCGKTQLVSYFLQERGSLYPHIIFVDASSAVTLKSDLQAWSQSLGPGHEQDVWEDALRVLANEMYRGKWVLILDNADDPRLDLAPFLPRCYHGTVIITSRNRDVGDLANTYHLELGEMREDEAFSTLLKAAQRQLPISPEETESAYALANQLGYLAVALVQAGTYCYQLSSNNHGAMRPFKFAEYAAIFATQRTELMKKAQSHSLDNYALGAYAAFDLSYKALPHRAKDFLHFTSSFDYPSISLSIYAAASAQGFDDTETLLPRPDDHKDVISKLEALLCPDGRWSETQAHKTILLLRSFSLITASSIASMVFIHLHPLVHAWARDTLSNSQTYQRMSSQVLTSCGNRVELYQYILPHIHDTLQANATTSPHVNDQFIAALILREHGYYDKAEELLRLILEMLGRVGKRDKEEHQTVSTNLARTYYLRGKWNEAEVLYLKVLEQQRSLLGQEHPQTILSAENLVGIRNSQGHYEEAEVLELKILEQRRRLLGREHPDTMLAAANLAFTYSNQGRYREAEALGLEALELQRRILGEEHSDTLAATGNLALVYGGLGRYSEAEVLELQVLDRRRRLRGQKHPETILAAANLACTYINQGRYQEAEVLQLEVLEQRRSLLGQEHPETIRAAANLAATYKRSGRCDEAEVLDLDVLEQRRKILGREHPETVRAAANFAATCRRQGRCEEAEVLQLEVLEQYKRLLGQEHPETIRAAANLGLTYIELDRNGEAEVLLLEVLEQRERILGQEHPDTVLALASLATNYANQGAWWKAAPLMFVAVSLSLRLLGQKHPSTKQRVSNLVMVLSSLGMSDAADDIRDLFL